MQDLDPNKQNLGVETGIELFELDSATPSVIALYDYQENYTLKDGKSGHRIHSRDERAKGKALHKAKFVDNICQSQQIYTWAESVSPRVK